jgi:hypothetical protein
VTASNVQEVQGVAAGSLSAHLQYSDADGDPAFHWRIQDVSSDPSTAISINGTSLVPGAPPIELTQAQFAAATIQSVSGSHEIWAMASDGAAWSSPVHFTLSPAVNTEMQPQSFIDQQAFENPNQATVHTFHLAEWLLH